MGNLLVEIDDEGYVVSLRDVDGETISADKSADVTDESLDNVRINAIRSFHVVFHEDLATGMAGRCVMDRRGRRVCR